MKQPRIQKLGEFKAKIDAMKANGTLPSYLQPRTATLEVVAPPRLMPRELYLQIGRKRYQVASLRDAVDRYCEARRKSGLGASEMPRVTIVDQSGDYLYTIRYNGTVWTTDDNAKWAEVAIW